MRIIRKGALPEAIEYEHTCWRCGTVFAATTKDRATDPKNESYVECPVCKAYVEWSRNNPVKVEESDTELKYADIENQAKKKYPDDVWKRYAFKAGAEYVLEEIYKQNGKTREEMFNDLEVPTVTMD